MHNTDRYFAIDMRSDKAVCIDTGDAVVRTVVAGDAGLYEALPRKRPGKRRAAQLLDDERGSR